MLCAHLDSTTAFVIGFSTFVLGCIDHSNISKKTSLADAVIPGCLLK